MRRGIAALLAAALLTALLCACTAEEETEESFQLWFVSAADNSAVSLGTEAYDGERTVAAVMAALLAGPGGNDGLTSPIPAGTRLQNWSRSGSMVQVDLSREYGSLEGVGLTLADYCITLTLTQMEGVDSVRVTVDGVGLPGRSQQTFRPEDVVLSGAEEEPVELIAALCFRRVGGNELGVEQRMFRLTESQSATLAVLQALVAGPQEAGLQVLLPESLEVYSARVEAGVCYADFSAALLEQIPETVEEQQLVVRSIVGSLCSLGYVQAVQLLVEGEPLTRYGQVDVSQPLN